ncbi:UNVERIFIED_CONTAM: hypothetical protein GTU68_033752, partial [Idotea baltica]|nr:hypothetical protein [Idotea baltica]
TDIDECENPDICQYGTCVNQQGTYVCECPPNYELIESGDGCVDRREGECYLSVEGIRGNRGVCRSPLGEPTTKSTCCCSIGRGWGPRCDICPADDSEEYEKLCPGGKGFRPNSITVVLEDIDECAEMENLCENGHCSNTFGSFMCSCNKGYTLNEERSRCIDVDECADRTRCKNGYCINTIGDFECDCPEGFMLLPNRAECIDMREEPCFMKYEDSGCSMPMRTDITKMKCCCSMGAAWGNACEECPSKTSREYMALCFAGIVRPGPGGPFGPDV